MEECQNVASGGKGCKGSGGKELMVCCNRDIHFFLSSACIDIYMYKSQALSKPWVIQSSIQIIISHVIVQLGRLYFIRGAWISMIYTCMFILQWYEIIIKLHKTQCKTLNLSL